MLAKKSSEPIRYHPQGDSFSVLAVNGAFESVSQSLLNATGWDEHECIGKRFHLFLHRDDFCGVEDAYQRALGGVSVQLGPLRCLTREGAYVPLYSSFVPRLDGGVRDILWLSHPPAAEIPDHKAAHTAAISLFKGAEPFGVDQVGLLALLQTLLANAPVGVALLDEDMKFICLNQTFSQMTGFSPDQQLGQSLLEVMPRVGRLIEPPLRKVFLQGYPVTDHETVLQRFSLSDHSRWGLLSFYPVPDGRGGTCGVAIIAVDITDRKRSEKALRESDERFRLAVDATKLGTWDMNFQTGKSHWSDRAKDILGLAPHSFVDHQRFLAKVHPEDLPRLKDAIERAKEPTGNGEYQIEYRISTAASEARWVASRGKVFFDANNHPLRFVGTSLDVTERKNAEDALKKLSEELTRSNFALDAFAHTASHDLKEPLRVITSFIRVLASRYKTKLDANADEYLEYISTGAERMGHLVDSILAYARTGRAVAQFEEVSCAAILETVLQDLHLAAEDGHVAITHTPMPVVWGNSDLLSQVFQNLIANAIKFRTREGAKIHVTAEAQGEKWLFSVGDNGIGIREDFLETVFSPFRRLHSQTEYAGSGLGLAICKQNVERHGGRIWVTAQEGKGSTFFFTLPVVNARP